MADYDPGKKSLFQMGGDAEGSEKGHETRTATDQQAQLALTFASLSAEGDLLLKHGDFARAVATYTRALEVKSGERNILISRSRCYQGMGRYDLALKDANRALDQEKTFFRAIYQKAETHFSAGEFENALIYYHRGMKVRPDLEEFRLGIQKSQKAIQDAIDGVDTSAASNARADGSPTADQESSPEPRTAASKATHNQKPSTNSQSNTMNMTSTGQQGGRSTTTKSITDRSGLETSRTNRGSQGRRLLGRLDEDKMYLQQLINDPKLTKQENVVSNLAEGGLKYLDKREDFWRQQNGNDSTIPVSPAIPRNTVTEPSSDSKPSRGDKLNRKKKPPLIELDGRSYSAPSLPQTSCSTPQGGTQGTSFPPIPGAGPHPKSAGLQLTSTIDASHNELDVSSPGKSARSNAGKTSRKALAQANAQAKMRQLIDYYVEQTHDCLMIQQHIDKAFATNDPETSLRFSKEFLQRLTTSEIPDKPRMVASLHNSIGTAYLALGKFAYAAVHYRKQLELSLEYEFSDYTMKALTSLGLTFQKMGQFSQALEVMNIKLTQGPEAEIPETYLSIGRCYLDSGDNNQGLKYAGLCLTWLDHKPPKAVISEAESNRLRFGSYGLAGSCLTNMGKNRDALQRFELQIQFARKMQDTSAEADALILMASCYTKLGETEKSAGLQQQAISLRGKKGKKQKGRTGLRKKFQDEEDDEDD